MRALSLITAGGEESEGNPSLPDKWIHRLLNNRRANLHFSQTQTKHRIQPPTTLHTHTQTHTRTHSRVCPGVERCYRVRRQSVLYAQYDHLVQFCSQ